MWEEAEVLEDHIELVAANLTQLFFVHLGHILAVNVNIA